MSEKRYKTELYIPIKQDTKSFEDRQRGIWENAEINSMKAPEKTYSTEMSSKNFSSKGFDKDFMSDDFDKEFSSMRAGLPSSMLRSDLPGSLGFGSDPFGNGDSKSMMDRMQARMDQRRCDWEKEIERMRKDFFSLTPNESGSDRGISDIKSSGLTSMGRDNKFQVSFDVKQFKPEEINVRTQDHKLIVHAKHEDVNDGRSSTREFSRQVDIPKHVDVEKLVSTLSSDGILQIEMEVPVPSYDSIKNGSSTRFSNSSNSSSLLSSNRPSSSMNTPGSSLFDSSFPQSSLSGGYNQGPVITEQDGKKTLKMEVDIGKDFNASDLNIKTINNKLQIHARHEETSGGRTSSREFSREFDLPDDVDPDAVTASMTDEGKLIIEAPISSYTKGSYQGPPGAKKQPTVSVTMRKDL